MSDFDSSSSIELNDLLRSVDSLVSQLDRCGAEIANRFQSRLDDETLASVVAPSEEPAQLADQVDELISDAIDAVDSLQDDIGEATEVADNDEQAVDDLASQVDELIADAEEVAVVVETEDVVETEGLAETQEEAGATVEDSAPSAADEVVDEVENQTDEAPITAAQTPVDEDSVVDEVSVDEDEVNAADEDSVDATFDASTDVIEEPVSETPPPVQNETIESLDSAIESEAGAVEDELDELDGEFASIDEIEELDSPPADPASKAPAADALPASKATADADVEDAAEEVSGSGSRLHQLIARVRTLAMSVTHRDGPVAQRLLIVLTPLARPLTKLDPKMRDTVGWVALNTLFIAICLWLFVVLR